MKIQRQAKIMEIISTRDIETQEQLLQALEAEGLPAHRRPFPGISKSCGGEGVDLLRYLPVCGFRQRRFGHVFRQD